MKKLLLGNEAVARGLYEAGVAIVSSYPGTPSTEITEAAAKYPEIYAEWAPNEKVATEVAIGSAIGELYAHDPSLTRRALFRAGMHIGRDMMGTDSNTLILAFAGGSISMLVLNYAYDLPLLKCLNSNIIGIAVMQGLSGSFGIVLAVPVTVLLSVLLYPRRRTTCQADEKNA